MRNLSQKQNECSETELNDRFKTVEMQVTKQPNNKIKLVKWIWIISIAFFSIFYSCCNNEIGTRTSRCYKTTDYRNSGKYQSFYWRSTIHISRFFTTWCWKCTKHISCTRLFMGWSWFFIGQSFVQWCWPFIGFKISCRL